MTSVFPGGNHRIIIAANLWIWDTVDKQLIMLYEKKKHICICFTFLTQMHDNWKYHKPKVASYWLVKLDSTKQRKVSCDLISCFLFPVSSLLNLRPSTDFHVFFSTIVTFLTWISKHWAFTLCYRSFNINNSLESNLCVFYLMSVND